MTWPGIGTAHRRGEVLRTVVDTANHRLDGRLPTDVDGVAHTFRDDLDLVGALQLRWHTTLAGMIERALADEPADLESAVLQAWRATYAQLAGVRRILDAYALAPTSDRMAEALDITNRKGWALMALMAGQASAQDAAAAEVGRRLEAKARRGLGDVPEQRHGTPGSLLERLRSALAA